MSEKINSESVSLSTAMDILYSNFQAQLNGLEVAVPYITGLPGAGKTECIRSLAIKEDCEFMSTHFALKLVEELGGIPNFCQTTINGKTRQATEWTLPDSIKRLELLSSLCEIKETGGCALFDNETGDIICTSKNKDDFQTFNSKTEKRESFNGDKKKRWVCWLLDDMHLCSAVHQAMLYELLTERKLRDFKLPNNVCMVMAGNTSQKAGAKVTFSAIVNRVFFMPIAADFQYWKENFALINHVHPAIIAFLSNDSYQSLHFHEEEQVDGPWASPRSWTRFSSMLKMMEETHKKSSKSNSKQNKLYYEALKILGDGHVGKTASAKFASYYKIFSEFDTKKLLNNPESVIDEINNFKESEGQIYALAFALISEYYGTPEKQREKAIPNLTLYTSDGNKIDKVTLSTCLAKIISIFTLSNNNQFSDVGQAMQIDIATIHKALHPKQMVVNPVSMEYMNFDSGTTAMNVNKNIGKIGQ